jgi:hypothetical protein
MRLFDALVDLVGPVDAVVFQREPQAQSARGEQRDPGRATPERLGAGGFTSG